MVGRTELAKKRYPSQTLLRRHAAIFRENSSKKEDIKFSIDQVNVALVENEPEDWRNSRLVVSHKHRRSSFQVLVTLENIKPHACKPPHCVLEASCYCPL